MTGAPIFVNGRFLGAKPGGVSRVASQLLVHLDRLQAAAPDDDDATWSLVFPRGVQPPALDAIRRRRRGVLSWQAWEQCELPWAARSGVLVNLCNTAPLLHRRSVTMIHDAQVFLTPESYSRAFAAWYRFALPRIGQTAARIITVSNYSRDCLVEFGIAPPDRISVVPNGGDHLQAVPADPAVLDRIGVAPGRYVLAAAGAWMDSSWWSPAPTTPGPSRRRARRRRARFCFPAEFPMGSCGRSTKTPFVWRRLPRPKVSDCRPWRRWAWDVRRSPRHAARCPRCVETPRSTPTRKTPVIG